MNRRTIGTIIGLVAGSMLLIGCPGGDRDTTDPAAVEMRAYTVPEGFDADQFRTNIAVSLSTGDVKLGTARMYPDGSLVVTAPRGVHDGIERLLADLEKRGPAPLAPPVGTATIRYWALLGQPGGDGQDPSDALRDGGALRPVLEELVGTYGPMRFALLEELRLTGTTDRDASSIQGRNLAVEQRVTRAADGAAFADIGIRLSASRGVPHHLETRVGLEPGKFIVLGQSAYNSQGFFLPAGWDAKDDILLFLVVAEQAD